MIPGKKEYAPGETAEILVNAPFYPAEGLLTLSRNGIIRTELQQKQHRDEERTDRQIQKRHGERQQENGLHIEKQEQQTKEIILRMEARLAIGQWIHAALVKSVLVIAAFDRGEKCHPHTGQGQRTDWNR